MNRTLKIICCLSLAAFFAICASSCRKMPSKRIIGKWEVSDVTIKSTVPYVLQWNKGAILNFGTNGTAVFTIQGIDFTLSYAAQQNTLTMDYTYQFPDEQGNVQTYTENYILRITHVDNTTLILDKSDESGTIHIECVRL